MTRIATVTSYQKSANYIQRANSRLDRISDQYNTGLKFRTASDAPADYSATMRMEKEIAMYEQYTVNSGYAIDSLNLEETTLSSANDRLDRVQTLLTSAVNASDSDTELKAVAAELEEIQDYLFGLMNATTTEGEYIFSGSRGTVQAFTKDNTGKYVYNGDNGQREINASSSVSVPVSDSGLSIFQNVATARSASTTNGNVTISYSNYDTFASYYENLHSNTNSYFDGTTPLSLTVVANGDNYDITGPDGNTVTVTPSGDGKTLNYNGLSIVTNGESSFTVQLDPPKSDNILNALSEVISALRTSHDYNDTGYMPVSELNVIISKIQKSVDNTQDSINDAIGRLGARQNILDSVIYSNEEISAVKEEAKATISEADLYETTADLAQVNSILQMSMKSFNYVTGTTLFDYIS